MCHQQTLVMEGSSFVPCYHPVFLAELIHSISQVVIFEIWYCPLSLGLVDLKKDGRCVALGINFEDLSWALEFSREKEYKLVRRFSR